MRSLFYLIGAPGSGKSSVVRELIKLGGYDTTAQSHEMCPHIVFTRHGGDHGLPGVLVELGVLRTSFPGTDGLAMNILPRALIFLSACPHDTIIAEGDRLACKPFFDGARERGWKVHVILLDMSPDRAALRRVQRGSKQNETWVRGRITKVQNLGREADMTIVADDHTAEELADVLRTYMVEQISGVPA